MLGSSQGSWVFCPHQKEQTTWDDKMGSFGSGPIDQFYLEIRRKFLTLVLSFNGHIEWTHHLFSTWKEELDGENVGHKYKIQMTLLMAEILHHLGCIQPGKSWSKLPTSTGEPKENPEIQRSSIANSPVDFQGLHVFPIPWMIPLILGQLNYASSKIRPFALHS